MNETFVIIENTNSSENAILLNQLRDKTYELECAENGAWTYRNEAELENEAMAKKLEIKAQKLKSEIDSLKNLIT